MEISNQPVSWQQLNTFRHGEGDVLNFKLSIRMGNKGNFSDFNVAWLLVPNGLV